MRALGYAGLTLLLSVPSFVLSVLTSLRLFFPSQPCFARIAKSNPRGISRAVYNNYHVNADGLTALPMRRERSSRFDSFLMPEASSTYITPSPVIMPKALMPDSPGRAPTLAKHSRYHLPFDVPIPLTTHTQSAPHSHSGSGESVSVSIHSLAPSHQRQPRESPGFDSIRSLSRQLEQAESPQHSPSPIIFASPTRSRAESQSGNDNNTSVVVVNVSHPHVPSASAVWPYQDPQEGEKDSFRSKGVDVDVTEATHVHCLGELPMDGGEADETNSLQWASGESIGKDELFGDRTEEGEETGSYMFPPHPRVRHVASGRKFPLTSVFLSILPYACSQLLTFSNSQSHHGSIPRQKPQTRSLRALSSSSCSSPSRSSSPRSPPSSTSALHARSPRLLARRTLRSSSSGGDHVFLCARCCARGHGRDTGF